jgi:hypothetical protein
VKGDLPEDPSGEVAATKVAAAKVAATKVAGTRRAKAASMPASKKAPRTATKRTRGRKTSITRETNSESDAKPSSEEGAHTDTPVGTVKAPGDDPDSDLDLGSPAAGLASSSSGAAAGLASSSGVAASSSWTGPTLSTLSGASDDEAIGSQGTSRPSFPDNINRCWFAPAGFHPFREYFY